MLPIWGFLGVHINFLHVVLCVDFLQCTLFWIFSFDICKIFSTLSHSTLFLCVLFFALGLSHGKFLWMFSYRKLLSVLWYGSFLAYFPGNIALATFKWQVFMGFSHGRLALVFQRHMIASCFGSFHIACFLGCFTEQVTLGVFICQVSLGISDNQLLLVFNMAIYLIGCFIRCMKDSCRGGFHIGYYLWCFTC